MFAALVSLPSPPPGFTQIPNAVLLNTDLSRDARFLYSILMQHGRAASGYAVFPSYARLCLLMSVSEPTARKAITELRHAGLVLQERRGQGRSNRYRLMARPKDSFVQERNVAGVEEDQEEEDQADVFDVSSAIPPIDISQDAEYVTE